MKKNLLKSKLKQIFLKHKLPKNHAEICSNYLIKAEILEAKGHGLARLKMYCDRIKAKVINPKPKIKIKKISSSASYIDADNSIGFVSADLGIKQAIKKKLPINKAIEFIDIGGPSMLRAAAKNLESVIPLCDSSDYEDFIRKFDNSNGQISIENRQEYAAKIFKIT